MSEIEQTGGWREAYARLERNREALEAGRLLPREEVQRILRKRAEALARPLQERQIFAEPLDLLVFLLAGERYAVDTAHVQDVVPLREITSLPCAPSFVLGVVNHRGRILPVLDFRRLFGLAGEGVPEGARLVATEAGGMRFAIFAETVAGITRVDMSDVAPPPVSFTDDQKAWLRGVTGEMVAVLDLEGMVRASRIVVNEEVS